MVTHAILRQAQDRLCPNCHEERIVPFSCKTRFCPSCGKVRTDEWVNRISKELLDVPHLHLTLTIAKEMRPYFDRDRSLLKLLLTTAADAVRQVIAATYGDMQVGLVYTFTPLVGIWFLSHMSI